MRKLANSLIVTFSLVAMASLASGLMASAASAKDGGAKHTDDLAGLIPWNPAKEDFISYYRHAVSPPTRVACGPDPLYRDQTLEVLLPPHHGAALDMFDAKGRFYDLKDVPVVFDPQGAAKSGVLNTPPPDTGHSYTYVHDVAQDTAEFSVRVEDLRKKVQGSGPPLFRASGVYALVVGEEIETEDPLIDGWCVIHYIDKTRFPGKPKTPATQGSKSAPKSR